MDTAGLVIDDLHRSFGDVRALAGVSLQVSPGSLHGFVGANGAGKTTTMRIVVGVDAADSGSVRVDGHEIGPRDRSRIGYLPEERGLYPDMRVTDQVVFLAQLHGLDRAAATARTAALLDRLGLTARADDRTSELSLGNQQRVQLAVALAHEPDLLVLDEPFSGLDPVAADVMAELLLEQAARGVPVLFSSHQLELVERLCDHVTIINQGRQVASGSIEELRRARAERRVRVHIDGDAPSWTDLAGVRSVTVEPGGVVVELAPDADEQVLLDAARRAGRVTHFAPVVPTLTELYRGATT